MHARAHEHMCNAVTAGGMERSCSQPVEQVLSYSTLSHMKPRTYRDHAWAQLAKSETFYVRGSPQERDLQRRLGLLGEEGESGAEDGPSDLEAQGAAPPPPPPPAPRKSYLGSLYCHTGRSTLWTRHYSNVLL